MPHSTATWNACETLFVHPAEPGFRCMGFAKTTSDGCCHNPINKQNRQAASSILETLSLLEPNTSPAKALLRALAPIILCVRYHRDQADTLYRELKKRMRAATHPEVNGASGTACHWRPRRTIRSRGWHDPLPTASSIASTTIRVTGGSAASASTPTPSGGARGSSSTSRPRPSLPAPEPPLTPISAQDSLLRLPNTSNTRAQSPRAVTGDQAPACTTRHTRRRPLDEDCPICKCDMTIEEELVWCKSQCGKNYHKECFDGWKAHQTGQGGAVTCGYCRAIWAAPCGHDEAPLPQPS